MKVIYTHPARTTLVNSNESYDLEYIKTIPKYEKDYKKYFTPVNGKWETKKKKKEEVKDEQI